ncbi:MAG: cation transporter [Ruminococcaceae bacterium]|nr:cation transporter [Oscillospiraceae bacterium]
MIGILSRIFIKSNQNNDDPRVRNAYGTLCGIVGIILNILLFAFKLLAGMLSGAISIMADAFNNLTDAGSSVITLIGFRMSGQKADKDHPFGHGRIEYISGFVVSMIILLVGFELAKSSVEKIISPKAVEFSVTAIIILACSALCKAYMAFYNFKIGKKISSAAMCATANDSLSDCVATSVVLVCLLVSEFFGVNVDAYCGLAVSAFVMFSGLKSAKETIDPLLGEPPTKELINDINTIVRAYPEVAGVHDLIVHDYGPGRMMISLHAEVSADADMLETHDMIDNIEKELSSKLNCDAVIHMDPIVTNDERTREVRDKIAALVTCIDTSLTIHDFRMVEGPTHTNVIFDVVVPYSLKKSDDEIKNSIETIVKTIDPNYYSVVSIDKSYI